MLKKLILNQLLKATLTSLKGKKRWLVILALVVAHLLQSAGLDGLNEFVADVTNLLQPVEG